MAYTIPPGPNATPFYPSGPLSVGPAVLPATAKTVLTDTSNAVQAIAALSNNVQEVDQLVVEVTATLSAGKLLAFLYNGTTAFQVADIAHAALTVSAVAGVSRLDFGIAASAPIIVPASWSLWLASAVAQPAGALVGTGFGKVW